MLPSTLITGSAPAMFVAQSHTPHDRCVRFALAVAGDDATLAGRRALPPLPAPVFHRLDRASFALAHIQSFQASAAPFRATRISPRKASRADLGDKSDLVRTFPPTFR